MNIPADDRGLAYGDGLFETLRVSTSGVPLRARHRARMAAAAQRLRIPFSSAEFDRQLDALLDGNTGVAKLILTRGSGGRGYAPPAVPQPRWIGQRFALPDWSAALRQQGLCLGVCDQRAVASAQLAGIKHLNRLDQVLARDQVSRHGWDEGLMLDQGGRPLELTSMNLFARFADQLWTASLTHAGVAGIARQWCLEQPAVQALRLTSKPLALAQLRDADEVFACNSVAGILPVRKLAVWQWRAGDLTRSLQQSFDRLFA